MKWHLGYGGGYFTGPASPKVAEYWDRIEAQMMKFVEHFPPPPPRKLSDKEKLAIEAAVREIQRAPLEHFSDEEIEKAVCKALGRKWPPEDDDAG